jgi:hypothetical protein
MNLKFGNIFLEILTNKNSNEFDSTTIEYLTEGSYNNGYVVDFPCCKKNINKLKYKLR